MHSCCIETFYCTSLAPSPCTLSYSPVNMALSMSRQATQRSAAAGSSRARCVKVAAVHQPGKAFVASAAAALLLCSPVMAAPLPANLLATVSENPVTKAIDKAVDKAESIDTPNFRAPANFGTAKGDNTAQGAAAPDDRPAVYAEALKTGEAQTNAPCPTGQLPCY